MAVQQADQLLATARSIMKEADYCFFMTHGSTGEIDARLMHPFEPDAEFNIWLGASPRSRKVHEILKDSKVTLAYISPRSTAYVTVIGSASVVTALELKRKYWRAYWTDTYPGGPDSDEYVLVKVLPTRIEFMNFTHAALPQPFGLKPNGLERKDGVWKEVASREDL